MCPGVRTDGSLSWAARPREPRQTTHRMPVAERRRRPADSDGAATTVGDRSSSGETSEPEVDSAALSFEAPTERSAEDPSGRHSPTATVMPFGVPSNCGRGGVRARSFGAAIASSTQPTTTAGRVRHAERHAPTAESDDQPEVGQAARERRAADRYWRLTGCPSTHCVVVWGAPGPSFCLDGATAQGASDAVVARRVVSAANSTGRSTANRRVVETHLGLTFWFR